MKRSIASGIMLALLLISVLTFVFDVQPVEASGTIYIRADGSIDPLTANITSIDNVTYTFTDNNYDSIVVERSNITVDGNGYTLQGPGSGFGLSWSGIDNVTIKNATIMYFSGGVELAYSTNCVVSGNNLTENSFEGFGLYMCSGNIISGNYITNNRYGGHPSHSNSNIISGNTINNRREGLHLIYSSNNIISGNNITNNEGWDGLIFDYSFNNTVTGNNVTNHWTSVGLWDSSGNKFYHNNFIAYGGLYIENSPNLWNNIYPSGGNYWSNYGGVDLYGGPYQNETGSDGIGDAPIGFDADNTDFYPLMSPYPSIHAISVEGVQLKTALAQGYSTKFDFQVTSAHFTETFNVTAYANSTVFDSLTNVTVLSGNSTNLTLTWNATSLPKGNYNISVHATPVPAELFTKDNTYTYWVLITIVGDVDGDRDVDVGDQRKVQLAMFSVLGSPTWDPNADVDCDEDVDVGDQRKQQLHMFESW